MSSRSRSSLMLVFILTLGVVTPVAAQTDAPAAASPVTYVDAEGVERGTISVTEMVDPFEAFRPDYPPQEGTRYVMLTVAFDASVGQPFEADPYDVLIQDADGYIWSKTSIPLPDDVVVPELQGQTMAPGNRISGGIGYVIPAAAPVDRVLYQPQGGRLIPLLDTPAGPEPALGEPVSYQETEGGTAEVTLGLADPFEGYDPSYPPGEGLRYTVVEVAFENVSELPVTVEPHDLSVSDAEGYMWARTSVNRPEGWVLPELESQTLGPGDRVSGIVAFAVPAQAILTGIHYQPESSRLLALADLTHEAMGVSASPPAAAPGATLTTGDCATLEAWIVSTRSKVERAAQMSREDAALPDRELLAAHAAEYAELAEAQAAETPPADAEDLHAEILDILAAYAEAIELIATAEEPDVAELTDAMNTFNEAGQRLSVSTDDVETMAEACGLPSEG